MKFLAAALFTLLSTFGSQRAQALEPIRIEIGKNYEGYSNDELRRRVWQLERAVAQLQDQVFQLAVRDGGGKAAKPVDTWTCHIESFGKTHIASGNTKASALAQVLKKCGDATNAMHCSESNAKCDNQ